MKLATPFSTHEILCYQLRYYSVLLYAYQATEYSVPMQLNIAHVKEIIIHQTIDMKLKLFSVEY